MIAKKSQSKTSPLSRRLQTREATHDAIGHDKVKGGRRSTDSKTDSTLQTDTSEPLYHQVASTLRAAIVRGIYPIGSRIPTEEELCERFEVSRHTIREALRRLREQGLITSRHGARPVVVPPSAQNAVRLWSVELSRDYFDYEWSTRLAIDSMEMVRVSKALAAELDIRQGEEWLRIIGSRHSGEHGPVIAWYEYFVNAKYATVGRLLPRHVGPLITLIEDLFSERIVKLKYSMIATPIEAEQAAALQVAVGTASLKVVTRCETAGDQVAMIATSLHRGGDIGYSITIQDRT